MPHRAFLLLTYAPALFVWCGVDIRIEDLPESYAELFLKILNTCGDQQQVVLCKRNGGTVFF